MVSKGHQICKNPGEYISDYESLYCDKMLLLEANFKKEPTPVSFCKVNFSLASQSSAHNELLPSNILCQSLAVHILPGITLPLRHSSWTQSIVMALQMASVWLKCNIQEHGTLKASSVTSLWCFF